MRLLLEVARAVRAALPPGIMVGARLSASEWTEGGFSPDEAVIVAGALKEIGIGYDADGPTASGAARPRADHRARRRRLPRRLHQDPQAAQPRPEQDGKQIGQFVAAVIFGILALRFPGATG